MKFVTGLVSISFRPLGAEKIIEITKNAGLDAIEWGGDVHVPAGDLAIAEAVAMKTREAGLLMPEYGTYYHMGVNAPEMLDKAALSARVLGVPVLRVWAYGKGSANMTDEEYRRLVADAKRICTAYPDLTFCTECHNHTLTDDYRANLRLIKDVDMPNFGAFWQPNQERGFDYDLESASALAPYVRSAHVFAWEGSKKFPLSHHADRWKRFVEILSAGREGELNLMLEFMHDNDPRSLDETARTLRSFVENI